MNKIKVGDKVIVTAGKDKGKTGVIKKAFLRKGKVLVDGVNLVTKSVKPTQENPEGGFTKTENFINSSNVALVSPKDGKATKVGFKLEKGKQVRYSKSCGSAL